MAEDRDFWIDLTRSLEDGRRVLQFVLAVIGVVAGAVSLWMYLDDKFKEKEELHL